MKHAHTGRKLGVSAPHRRAMMRTMTLAIIERDAIKTTPARAKELRWFAERVVTLAKYGDVHSRRQIISLLGSTETTSGTNRVRSAIAHVYSNLVPRFKDRPGGYTQILRLAKNRAGDNAEMCVIRYMPELDEKAAKKDKDSKAKKTAKGAGKADSKKKVEAAASDKGKPREKKAASKEPESPKDKVETKSKKKDKE